MLLVDGLKGDSDLVMFVIRAILDLGLNALDVGVLGLGIMEGVPLRRMLGVTLLLVVLVVLVVCCLLLLFCDLKSLVDIMSSSLL